MIWQVVVNTVCSFVVLFVLAKLLGRKQIAGLDFIDYVMGITIGSIAGQWATSTEGNWFVYLIALGIFFGFSIVYTVLENANPFLKEMLKGKPLILINNGKIFYPNLKKSKISITDLLSICRSQGYFDITEIAYAIFETSGNVSVLPKTTARQVKVADFKAMHPNTAMLTDYIVLDGLPNLEALEKINKDTEWLRKKLRIRSMRKLKNILLASYNKDKDEIEVHYKRSSFRPK
ncbi:MAG: DUF421 domain-containing protein [Christensenellaceae bacterium]|jgi:uncharacterized membrane protein YcaP (DUF421 family)|nr:DUF421 domain-containing protein [Christensenellaceae bacterium]